MDFDQIYKICSPYTVTSLERMRKLYESVIYLNKNAISGSYVECGVFKGGSVMNMALTQLNFNQKVHIYLYDTFEGMTSEGKNDVNYLGESATKILRKQSKRCICGIEEVKKNMNITHYPKEFLHYYKGDVATTLQSGVPKKIALLRLDTDWYESTKIELEILYPRLVMGGILILDDYGYWKGARKATDDYFHSLAIDPQFEPIDTGVGAVFHIKKG